MHPTGLQDHLIGVDLYRRDERRAGEEKMDSNELAFPTVQETTSINLWCITVDHDGVPA